VKYADMKPEELNEAIAKCQGWKKHAGYMDAASQTKTNFWSNPDKFVTSVLPDWAGSIAIAWDLVQEMIDIGLIVEVGGLKPKPYEGCWCNIQKWMKAKYRRSEDYVSIVYEAGNTAPIAICRARLALEELNQ